jgi:hypothetical protein
MDPSTNRYWSVPSLSVSIAEIATVEVALPNFSKFCSFLKSAREAYLQRGTGRAAWRVASAISYPTSDGCDTYGVADAMSYRRAPRCRTPDRRQNTNHSQPTYGLARVRGEEGPIDTKSANKRAVREKTNNQRDQSKLYTYIIQLNIHASSNSTTATARSKACTQSGRGFQKEQI